MAVFADRHEELQFKKMVECFVKKSIKETIGKGPQNVKIQTLKDKLEIIINGIIIKYEEALMKASGCSEEVERNRTIIEKHVTDYYIKEFSKLTGRNVEDLSVKWDFENDRCIVLVKII